MYGDEAWMKEEKRMGFLKDAAAVFKKKKLVFKERRQIGGDVYTFRFEKPEELSWRAGQHGLFTITHKKVKPPTKPFTISSSPREDVIEMTTRIDDRPSDYKQALLELEPGMEMTMSGPVGSFHTDDGERMVFIAGGIGITPFHAMLRELSDADIRAETPPILLYVDGEGRFTYSEELSVITDRGIAEVHFIESSEELHKELELLEGTDVENYLIAGPYSMVESVSKHLVGTGVPKKNIRKETFIGY